MFSYREFADGAAAFRRQIRRQADPEGDKDYEVRRADKELAVINLSYTTDPIDLVNIYTHLLRLLTEARGYGQVLEYDNCVRLSAAFTYNKLISQQFGLAISDIDVIYNTIKMSFGSSGGGIIFNVIPTTQGWASLARARAKVPITDAPSKTRVILHEAFVALVALNPLRRLIPSFSYVFACWQCGNFVASLREGGAASTCGTPGSRPILIYESVPEARSLNLHLNANGGNVDLASVLGWLLQIVGALQMANDFASYTHYDLHSGNVLVQQLPGPITIEFSDYSVTVRERIVIIDNGLAYCGRPKKWLELFGPTERSAQVSFDALEQLQLGSRMQNFGAILNQELGVSRQGPFPLGDVFRIFFDIYSLLTPSLRVELAPLVSHFFVDANRGRRLRDGLTAQEQASSMFNGFALPPFREDLKKYQYRDFSQVIFDNYRELLAPLTLLRTVPHPVLSRSVRLSDVFNWQSPDTTWMLTALEIGMCGVIDHDRAVSLLREEGNREREKMDRAIQTLRKGYECVAEFIVDARFTTLRSSRREFNLDDILDPDFHVMFRRHVALFVLLVMAIRELYTRILLITTAIGVLGEEAHEALEIVSQGLNVLPQSLISLPALCCKLPLNKRIRKAVVSLTELATTVNSVVMLNTSKDTTMERPQRTLFNWYRACLPGVFQYLQFCGEWGRANADFGQFALAVMPGAD